MAVRGSKETSHLRVTGMHEKFIKQYLQTIVCDHTLHLHVHNSHFTDPLFKLVAINIKLVNIIHYKNLIAQYNLVQQLCTIYNMSITNFCV